MSARRLPTRRKQEWGQLGPAMKALPNDQWRAFAEHFVTEKPGHGALTDAARKAGFGRKSTSTNLAKIAWRMDAVRVAFPTETRTSSYKPRRPRLTNRS
jgi:hypothetical protein